MRRGLSDETANTRVSSNPSWNDNSQQTFQKAHEESKKLKEDILRISKEAEEAKMLAENLKDENAKLKELFDKYMKETLPSYS